MTAAADTAIETVLDLSSTGPARDAGARPSVGKGSAAERNAADLERELAWFTRVVDTRLKLHFGEDCGHREIVELAPPELDAGSPYADFVYRHGLDYGERLAVVLALLVHVRPRLLDVFLISNRTLDRRFTELGGRLTGSGGDFRPTGETLLFVLAGEDLALRFRYQDLLAPTHRLFRWGVLRQTLQEPTDPAGPLAAPLTISAEYISRFTIDRPEQGDDFPARRLETELAWHDLVLHPGTRRQVEEIGTWIEHGDTLLHEWGLSARLRPGYRALFYGPPGTGKTMTAGLLGRRAGRPVYKIDLSRVVSKYIGDTEKNLARVFDRAQHRGWMLFFDEADALFGKRSETRDAHDRYANQEVAFLLQRIEVFDGIVMLASNRRENLDEAFARRFESIIYFPLPRPEERLELWRRGLPAAASLESGLDLESLARDHELSGGSILNVIRWASLQTLARGSRTITGESLRQGIRREQAKEGQIA